MTHEAGHHRYLFNLISSKFNQAAPDDDSYNEVTVAVCALRGT